MGRRKTVHPPSDRCALCGRERPLTFHHLVPRSQHRRGWCKARFTKDQMDTGADLCTDCHSAIHRFISEVELARSFYTLDQLRAHPELAKFIAWATKQRSARSRTRTWGGRS
jgi:hypothetical protein